MKTTRRGLLSGSLAMAAASDVLAEPQSSITAFSAVDRSIANFNHAGVGTCPDPVLAAVQRHTRVGEAVAPNTIFSYGPRLEPIRQGLAAMLGCSAEEVAITRNATEALQAVLLGIPLRAGDEVLTTTLDYWAMLDALQQRQERDGVAVKKLKIPSPCTDLGEIVELFEKALSPRTKLILISHPINLNGQLMPVRELSRLAHARGIEVVVDAAQSFGLIDYKIGDLECDYLGTSLHKWLQAPKGSGMLYVKREKIEKVWPLFASGATRPKNDIRKFELYGTWPETILAIGDALAFHTSIGAAAKEAKLRGLTQSWLDRVRQVPGLRLHTPLGRHLSCGITCVELAGIGAGPLQKWLLEKRQILTMDVTRRTREFSGVRISPGLSTTAAELDQLVQALTDAPKALAG